MFDLRRIISNAWLVLRYIGLGGFIIMDIFWRNKYFKAPGRDTSIFSSRERTCGNKRQKMPCYNLLEDGTWALNVRGWDLLLVSLYLRFVFRVCIFWTFCYISWATLCHVAFSDYYDSILFFHVCSSALQISTKLAVNTAQWRWQMICTNKAITIIITMMIMMIVWLW